ncbi:MAG: hypothetical protein AB1921_01725 [Thermodesulfobacteriota bacterium]
MKILFLDQNIWISLAEDVPDSGVEPKHTLAFSLLSEAVENGKVLAPLTMGNIIETSKINDHSRRRRLTAVQNKFSKGKVFRSYKGRLSIELRLALQIFFNEPIYTPDAFWFIGDSFVEAFEPFDGLIASAKEKSMNFLLHDALEPQQLYSTFMLEQGDDQRKVAIKAFYCGTKDLTERIERRREQVRKHSKDKRHKIYSALLFVANDDLIGTILQTMGYMKEDFLQAGESGVQQFMRDVPNFYVETNLALNLESLRRPIEENDCLDISSLCAAIPYADCIVCEKMFAHISNQERLGNRYNTKISRNLSDLTAYLQEIK